MLVFQSLLAAGYYYVHPAYDLLQEGDADRFTPLLGWRLHCALGCPQLRVAVSNHPEKAWKPANTVHSGMHTIVTLLVAVGLHFSVLSTTAPLLHKLDKGN